MELHIHAQRQRVGDSQRSVTCTGEDRVVCAFAVDIVPNGKDLKVTVFGPLRLQHGTLPDWLK
jgi:hypothetical protein